MGERADDPSGAETGAVGDDSPGSIRTWVQKLFRRPLALDPQTGTSVPMSPPNQEAQTMLRNVHLMGDVRIESICVPRADIVSVPDTATLDEVVEVFRASTFTRLPVFSETLDNPIGLVHLKDLALHFGFGQPTETFDLRSLKRSLLYAPPSMPMDVLLQKMQSERIHMALVIDEYGGVDGLVTIEDLVEQIVGEIADEHDAEEDALWVEEAPGVYLSSTRLPLQDFEAISGVNLIADAMEEDIDTLGGLVFMLAGRVPVRGEIVCHPDSHEFEVVDADPRSLKRVRVRLRSAAALDQAAE